MYLKSLTLKGFKSFADRTVMKFEPGVAAIVGPNGSGKSNIADAILWVLGERNARNLRGQSMEDVIFAGSSARKPVSVAEVELLLDNSDGTLPVDFAEVSIGRRMYRSGESEYLINGNIVRRMDVLDILHDSGLGTGTNSIISQGNLDSVLSSSPEDRRALIEEAAGILKHKERKAKSERKLTQMDAHLNRVFDITAEVERQLKPLERKAKKAELHRELSSELKDLRLQLAVDDLRALQARMNETQTSEKNLEASQQQAKVELEQREAELDQLQHVLQEAGSAESALHERYRYAQTLCERFNSTVLVLGEKKNIFRSEIERVTGYLAQSEERKQAAEQELEQARQSSQEAERDLQACQTDVRQLEEDYAVQTTERNELRKKLDTLTAQQRSLQHRKETIQATQEALKENLSEKRARAQVIDAHISDARMRFDSAQSQVSELQTAYEALASQSEQAQSDESFARGEVERLTRERDTARHAMDEAREAYTRSSAQCRALEELERTSQSSNRLLAEMLEQCKQHNKEIATLSHIVKVPSELDSIMEMLLGDDVRSLLTSSYEQACGLIDRTRNTTAPGSVSVLFARDTDSQPQSDRRLASYRRLLDEVDVQPPYRSIIETLLGNVYVVDTFEDALAAQEKIQQDVRFASLDGCVVEPSGEFRFARFSEQDKQHSALVLRRDLEQARSKEQELLQRYQQIQQDVESLEGQLREAQTRFLTCSESLASLKGKCSSALTSLQEAQQAMASLEEELERLEEEKQQNERYLQKTQPDSDELETELSEVLAKLELNKEKVGSIEKSLSPLRKAIVALSEKLSNARLESARLSERFSYTQRLEQARKQEIVSSLQEDKTSKQRMQTAQVAVRRADMLLETTSKLLSIATQTTKRLEQDSRDKQKSSHELHEKITRATQESREARDRFEEITFRLSELRVEKGRLEVQVDTGIKTIIEDCETPLEQAIALPALEQRSEAIQRVEFLERRLKNMGSINPDAAKEYEEINERYQYLSAQLEDMRVARRLLLRIVSMIDERMKNDFIDTFDQVNANFGEIFFTLFPGGHARLSLVDPDDIENTGVDVNAQPVGKRVKKMSLLSGGEKSMTALALLFAVYRTRQTPFYVLDEVEAALDDTNLRRLLSYLSVIRETTQFIMITHQRRTMESADILYGVSMQADGITKVVSQKLDSAQRKEG